MLPIPDSSLLVRTVVMPVQLDPHFYETDDNYSSAAVNVLVLSDCDGSMVCSKTFLAQSGTLDITSIGGVGSTFAGTLSDVVLIEVTIDPGTFESTPVADGEEWCIADYAFNVTVN